MIKRGNQSQQAVKGGQTVFLPFLYHLHHRHCNSLAEEPTWYPNHPHSIGPQLASVGSPGKNIQTSKLSAGNTKNIGLLIHVFIQEILHTISLMQFKNS